MALVALIGVGALVLWSAYGQPIENSAGTDPKPPQPKSHGHKKRPYANPNDLDPGLDDQWGEIVFVETAGLNGMPRVILETPSGTRYSIRTLPHRLPHLSRRRQ